MRSLIFATLETVEILDALWGGGHSSAILKFENAKVVALDRDSQVSVIANKLKKNFILDFF